MHYNLSTKIAIVCTFDELLDDANTCAHLLGTEVNAGYDGDYILHFSESGVSLVAANQAKASVQVDFCHGKDAHRRLYGGGKGQMIAKAVGISSKFKPSVFDATAGLGGDAFVLASLGCHITLMERSPVAFYLLKDGLRRGRAYATQNDPELNDIFKRIQLMEGDSIQYLRTHQNWVADVIYLDPMFPSRQKKAAVKKEMQAFHGVVGEDLDGELLFSSAQNKAQYRIAVKRPRLAPTISDNKPNYCLEGKSSRYDIYTYKSMN